MLWSKITPKLRTGEVVVNVFVEAESRLREMDGITDLRSKKCIKIGRCVVAEGFVGETCQFKCYSKFERMKMQL